jgi:hypothetical protein
MNATCATDAPNNSEVTMGTSKSNPPTNWASATDAGGGTYYLIGETQADIIVWHWCTQPEDGERPRWLGQSVTLHTLLSMDPLHLEPSLTCADGCPWHGFLRGGRWTQV